jgi:hypothetical protein
MLSRTDLVVVLVAVVVVVVLFNTSKFLAYFPYFEKIKVGL